ncbi:MAG: MFS transporter [Candidatus Pseudobacter hemicellulosilyticus]|uniref:MFS transporter n=1 Tax=Candidatus Pseudobacter hemicellulosilyticus TaxID=3121375 RepID=A0AAJ5WXK5_9BACT|nr:MAG: MFS transporter [Pseudobacter sp.]
MKKSLLSLALGGLGIGTTEFVIMGLLPDIAGSFDISIPEAGHLISAYALGVVIGAPTLVAFSGSYPPKKILIGLMALFTLFNGLTALAPGYTSMVLARLFSGLPHGAFFGVGAVVASRLADKGKAAQAISIMFAGLTIANLAMVPLGTYIGHNFSWRFTFGIIAGIGLITMLAISVWMPAMPVKRKGSLKEELRFFRRTDAWLIILLTAIGTGGLFSWISYIAPLMIHVTHFNENLVPYIMMLAGLGMLAGNFLGGKMADILSPAKACMLSMLGIVACLVVDYFTADNQVMTLVMTFLTGAIAFTLSAPIQLLMIQTAKDAEMLGASVTQAGFNMGNALGAYWGGLPIAAGFGFASPLLVGVGMAIFGIFILWLLMRHQDGKSLVLIPGLRR